MNTTCPCKGTARATAGAMAPGVIAALSVAEVRGLGAPSPAADSAQCRASIQKGRRYMLPSEELSAAPGPSPGLSHREIKEHWQLQ